MSARWVAVAEDGTRIPMILGHFTPDRPGRWRFELTDLPLRDQVAEHFHRAHHGDECKGLVGPRDLDAADAALADIAAALAAQPHAATHGLAYVEQRDADVAFIRGEAEREDRPTPPDPRPRWIR